MEEEEEEKWTRVTSTGGENLSQVMRGGDEGAEDGGS
jgi:hypothetical protein